MRSPTSAAAALALGLAAAGCGTWSNEDLRFLAALPTADELRVAVPAGAAAAVAAADGRLAAVAAPACGPHGASERWLWAKPTSDQLNASVDGLLGLVDLVRRFPPTTRLDDGRIWGPFDDDRHPGVQLRIVILRSWPQGPDGPAEHAYAFEARRPADGGPFQAVLSGTFVGASAVRGHGALELRFDLLAALGMADPGSPGGVMRVDYDRTAEPRAVALTLTDRGASQLLVFDYRFAGYADGRGRLRYAFENGAGDRAVVAAGFDAAGGGQGEVTYYPAALGGASVGYRECWGADACLVYSDDESPYSCGAAVGGCAFGDPADCAAVPPP